MNEANRKFKYSDMEECMELGSMNASHQKQFLATFQRQRGFPKPKAASKQLVNIKVEVIQVLETGTSTEKALCEKIWKLPRGAVTLAINDCDFRASLLSAYSNKSYTFGAFFPELPCIHCNDKTVTRVRPEAIWKPEKDKMRVALMFFCGQTSCHMKLEEKQRIGYKKLAKLNQSVKDYKLYWCESCGKSEPYEGPKFFACGECKVAYYCNRECQKDNWFYHKESCEVNFRGKLSKEEQKLDVSKMYDF